jgi:hypothetical protein
MVLAAIVTGGAFAQDAAWGKKKNFALADVGVGIGALEQVLCRLKG